jgi:Zn-dependent membrane protease YugP
MMFSVGLLLNIFLNAEFGLWIAALGVVFFAVAVLFSLVTLPVEFDASKRAKQLLVTQGILFDDEMVGVNKVLDAAALTYVAAAVAAIGQLLYYLFILMGRRD